MGIKDSIKKHKLFIFFSIIIIIFLSSLISTNNYYNDLEKKANFNYYKDIPYINLEDVNHDIKYNLLDIYTPKKTIENKLLPVVIFVHGGAWTDFFGNKDFKKNSLLKSIFYTDNNFILVTINYRVFPEVKFPVYVKDVSSSIKWVYNNIGDYNGNKDLIFIQGHSAGAQIISLISTDESYLLENDLDLNVIKGTILLEGIGYDILKYKDFDIDGQIINKYLMFPFGEDDEVLKKASSINYINDSKNIPPMIVFSAQNSILRIGKFESLDLYLKLIKNNIYAEHYIVKERNHSTLHSYFGEKDDFTTKKTLEFLNGIINNYIKR